MLGLASCQTEPEGLNVNVGGEVDTVVTVTIPETETRADYTNSAKGVFDNGVLGGDATMRYIFQVYYNGQESEAKPQVAYSDGQTVTFPVRLVPDRDYTFVVWADVVDGKDAGDKHYIVYNEVTNRLDLSNISVNETSWVAMDESRDAFTVTKVIEEYNGQMGINLELKRALAKLRVVTTDMEALNNLNIAPTYATVAYSTNHYSTFNAVNGTCSDKNVNKSHSYFIESYNDHNGETSKVLFTDYFFANNQEEVVNFTLNVYDQQGINGNVYTINDDYLIKSNPFNTPIPARRNYLTTIQGNVLTDGNNIKVDVTDAFANAGNLEDEPYFVEIWDGKSIEAPELVTDPTTGEDYYSVENGSELAWLAAAVNGTLETRAVDADNFAGKTFKLTQDIDLGGNAWTPISMSTDLAGGKTFRGTFDGNGHTIKGLYVRQQEAAGLFGYVYAATIKNVTIEGANLYSNHYAGGVVAWVLNNQGNIKVPFVMENCHVKNSTISSTPALINGEWDNGDKAGGLVGYVLFDNEGAVIKNCSVENTSIKAYRDFAGFAGYAKGAAFVNCAISNVTLEQDLTHDYKAPNTPTTYGLYIGRNEGGNTFNGNEMVANGVLKTGENEYGIYNGAGLVWAEAQADNFFGNKTIKLMNNIDMTGVTIEKPIHFWGGRTTFDGQNYTISNLTMSTTSTEKKPFGLFGGTADIKNVKFDKANISGYSYVAVVAGNLYGNIENCHVSNSSVTCTYWMAGAMSGQYNAGNVTNCSVTNTTITGPAAVGALIGNINETAGERKVENCTVTGCTVAQNRSFGGDYDKMFGTAVGLVNIENSKVYINGCKVEDTTVKGATSANIFGLSSDNTTIYVDDYTYTPDGIIKDENGNLIVNSLESLEAALETAGAAGAGDTTIVFAENAQLNMTGAEWTPIKVDGYNGADIVTIEGNGAVITGLEAPLFAGGFAGGSGIVIKDLTIKDSNIVSANTIGSGAFIESVDSMAKIELTNCHLLNSTVTGGAGSRTGGLIGWTAGYSNQNDGPVKTYVTIDGCSVIGCTITCDGSVGGINGHAGNNDWTYTTIKNCTIKNNTLASADDGAWRTGVVVGTANVGEVTISNITESGNTLTQTGKTAPVGFLRNLYGRAVLGATGKLTIDGYKYVAEGLFEDANGNAVVGNQTALADALAAGKTNVTLTAGSYELYGLNFVANNVTLKGVDKANVVLNLENSIYLQNKSVTLENLTYNLNAGKGYTEQAFAYVHHATAFNLKNCNVNRLRLNVYEANIEDCTFTLNTSSGFDGYCIYYYGNDNSTVNVKNSTFATAGKGICIYSEHAKAYNLNVDKCSFTSSDSATDKAAIQMHTELGISGNVKITETTATGFANINGGLWNELNNNTKVATDMFDIWVDGTQVH